MKRLTHLDAAGRAAMVDVAAKPETRRAAAASGMVRLLPETLALLADGALPKGDAFAVARVAGIQAAKRTSEWIPLCHQVALTSAAVEFEMVADGVVVRATAATTSRTGVEMEALVAVSAAALALYDMVKAVDRSATITDVQLDSKSGGRSGTFRRAAPKALGRGARPRPPARDG